MHKRTKNLEIRAVYNMGSNTWKCISVQIQIHFIFQKYKYKYFSHQNIKYKYFEKYFKYKYIFHRHCFPNSYAKT